MTDTKVYPIVIHYDSSEKSIYKYLVFIPDLDGYTQGESLADAIAMARDYLGTYSLENELPEPNKLTIAPTTGDTVTLVDINPQEYKQRLDKTPVKKTLSIPTYLNEAAIKEGINFSQTLSEALKEKLALL